MGRKAFVAPHLAGLEGRRVSVDVRKGKAGFEAAKVYYKGRYVTDAFCDLGVPWNKRVHRMLEECNRKRCALYL